MTWISGHLWDWDILSVQDAGSHSPHNGFHQFPTYISHLPAAIYFFGVSIGQLSMYLLLLSQVVIGWFINVILHTLNKGTTTRYYRISLRTWPLTTLSDLKWHLFIPLSSLSLSRGPGVSLHIANLRLPHALAICFISFSFSKKSIWQYFQVIVLCV